MDPEAGPKALPLHNAIRPSEWLLSLSGIVILVGLGLEWADGSSGYEAITVLRVLVLLLALASVPIPLMLWLTIKSDVPIIWETLLLTYSGLLAVILVVKVAVALGDGFGPGFWIVFGSCLVNAVAAWYAVSREQ